MSFGAEDECFVELILMALTEWEVYSNFFVMVKILMLNFIDAAWVAKKLGMSFMQIGMKNYSLSDYWPFIDDTTTECSVYANVSWSIIR